MFKWTWVLQTTCCSRVSPVLAFCISPAFGDYSWSQSEVSVLFDLNICGIFSPFELSGGIVVRIQSSFTFYLQFYEVLKNETQFVT